MSRRELLKGGTAFAAGSALRMPTVSSSAELPDRRPNILFIMSDDQGPWAMGCSGNREVRTPNLDLLASTGMRFDNFFCTSPVCSAARASVLTGQIPSQNGVHDWIRTGSTVEKYEPEGGGKLIEYLKGQLGYTDYLAATGYKCGMSGKWHLGDSHHPQKSFSFWEVHVRGGGNYYSAPMIRDGDVHEEPKYITHAITDNAIRFLEECKAGDAPFYLSVHYTAPHSPWERKHHPAELFDEYRKQCPFKSVPDGLTPPEWVQKLNIPVKDAEMRREHLSGYFAAVTAMDAEIGRLLDWLRANGRYENTLVCFISDNGMNMGHNGFYGKGNATFPMNMFEESVKVPCIFSHPGSVPQGKVSLELLSQYDLMPTLLDYVGIEDFDSNSLPGRSFSQLLRGQEITSREHIVVCSEYGPVRMVRTKDWKYVHRYPYGPHELFHLGEDPEEDSNLISDKSLRGKVRDMRARLEDWFARYADPERDGRHLPVTGSGQGGLVGRSVSGLDRFY